MSISDVSHFLVSKTHDLPNQTRTLRLTDTRAPSSSTTMASVSASAFTAVRSFVREERMRLRHR